MLRFLVLFSLVLFSSSFRAGFKSKAEALNYLNNSNIWVAGTPEYELNNKTGLLTLTLKMKATGVQYRVDLSKLKSVELLTEKVVSISLNCAQENCIEIATNKEVQAKNQATLIMHSTFDDGDYRDRYLEKGAKIVEALDLLARFYRE